MAFRGLGLRTKLRRLLVGDQALYNAYLPYTSDYFARQRFSKFVSAGKHTYGKPNVIAAGPNRLDIGSYCSIAGNVEFWLGGNHRSDWVTSYPFSVLKHAWPNAARVEGDPSSKGSISVGSDVWIGADARILSGVKIGHGAVVGTRAVVAKDIPPYAVAVGNPARIVKYRFTPVQIEALLSIQWWNWPEDRIHSALPMMLLGNPDQFIAWAASVI